MEDFLKMDVFFVVTTAAVFLGGVLCAVALVYIIRILKSVDHVAQNVSDESDEVRGDLGVLRAKIREEGVKIKHFSEFFTHFATRRRGKKKAEHESS